MIQPGSQRLVPILMQKTIPQPAAEQDFSIHYFLRPDHRDVADLWLASGGHAKRNIDSGNGREWLFLHMENLHRAGAYTACAFNRHTGNLAGFVTINTKDNSLDQIIVAQTARGTGVATLLLNEAKRIAVGPISISVSEDNGRAIRFCEREGFSKTGVDSAGTGQARVWTMRWQDEDATIKTAETP